MELLTEKSNINKLFVFIVTFFIFGYTLKNSDRTLVFGLLFAYAARKIDAEKILRFTFRYCCIQYITVLISSFIGIIKNDIIVMYDGRLRYSLGFGHPNNTSLYFFVILLLFFSIKKGKMKMKEILFWGATSIVIYNLTKCRTGIIMDMLVLIISIFYKPLYNLIVKSIFIKFVIAIIAPLFAVLNYVIAFQYDKSMHIATLNALLTGRFGLASRALQKWGLSICGRPVQWTYDLGQQYLVVDSSYIRNLIEFGLIAFILLLVYYFAFSWCCINNDDIAYALGMMLIAIYANMEIILAVFGINPLLVLFGPVLFNAVYSYKNSQKRKVVSA